MSQQQSLFKFAFTKKPSESSPKRKIEAADDRDDEEIKKARPSDSSSVTRSYYLNNQTEFDDIQDSSDEDKKPKQTPAASSTSTSRKDTGASHVVTSASSKKPNAIISLDDQDDFATAAPKASKFTYPASSATKAAAKPPAITEKEEAKWFWRSDQGWVAYDEDLSDRIEKAYKSRENHIVKIDDNRFIDLKANLQRRFDDNSKVRTIKREIEGKLNMPLYQNKTQEVTKSPYFQNNSAPKNSPASPSNTGKTFTKNSASSVASSNASGNGRWFWDSDKGKVEYDADTSETLEKAFKSGNKKQKVSIDKERFVDLEWMLQRRFDDHGKTRRVIREAGQTLSSAKPFSGKPATSPNAHNYNPNQPVVWLWESDKSQWEEYAEDQQKLIERAFVQGEKTVKLDAERYLDLENMVQRRYNDKTRCRYVKRRGPPIKKFTAEQLARAEANRQEALKKLAAKKKLQEQQKEKEVVNLEDSDGEFDFAKIDFEKDVESSDDEDFDLTEEKGLEKKRSHYKCKDKFITLDSIPPLPQVQHMCSSDEPPLFKPNAKINSKISLLRADITTLEIDAIVNAAKPSLMGGGGIDGAIHAAAGRGLLTECITLDGCEVGDAKITTGHKLPAKFVIHTVGPIGEDKPKLISCYKRCLELLVKHRLKSVALCGISTGIYGYPLKQATHIALATVRRFLENGNNCDKVDRIIFCVFLDKEEKTFRNLINIYFPPVDSESEE